MAETTGRPTRRWRQLLWVIPAALLLLAIVVLVAQWLRGMPEVQSFLATYPGDSELPAGTPVGFPAWLNWQHFLSSFLLLFVVRTGWELRKHQRPTAFWTRNNTGRIRTTNAPVRIGVPTWFHLTLTALWVLNGGIFYVLIFATGQWARIVPVSWDVVPNAISAGLQYASLDWPVHNGWVNYNALQLLSYFATVFVAAPLALATGIRLAPGLAGRWARFDRVFPRRFAVWVHVAVMFWFIGFTIVHVTLVLTTGAVRNLNHMYAGRDDDGWLGFAFFGASLVLMAVCWFFFRPATLANLAEKTGTVRRL
jgi:thiosulfate reductase cytochrome b subunit